MRSAGGGGTRADHLVDAADDDFGELGLAFLAEEFAVVGGDGLEVVGVFRVEALEVLEGFFEMAAGP